jgi:outer membrane receptor protein involved in Fe transport
VSPYYIDAQGSNSIPSQIYHDIFGSYTFGTGAAGQGANLIHKVLSDFSVQFGIKNILNKSPPFDAINSPYYYSTYGDARLRSYRVGIQLRF